MARVAGRFGGLDILVNNAGVLRNAPLAEMTDAAWDLVVDVHLKGAFLCARAAQRFMVPRRYGKIVTLSSAAAEGSSRGQANYAAAKAGIIGLTKTLAIELGPHNINVNAVGPGATASDMTRATAAQLGITFDQYKAEMSQRIALRRIGEPEEIADVICFLVSDAARYISGEILYVRGGPGR
jgi:3-oxoacyl-[acyl-carrier protein] reductase